MEPGAILPAAGLVSDLLATVRHGGTVAVVVAILCTAAVLAVAVWSLPRVARPVADAIATIRGGATVREGELTRKVQLLEDTVRQLLHHKEEQRRLMAAMLDQMECKVEGCAMPELRKMFETLVQDDPGPAATALLSQSPAGAAG